MASNSRPHSDSFEFVIPVLPNSAGPSQLSSPQMSSSSSSSFQNQNQNHLNSAAQLSPFHSSTRNYRHSALVESGQYEYRPPVSPATSYASAHSTVSAMDLDAQPQQHVSQQQRQLGRLPSVAQLSGGGGGQQGGSGGSTSMLLGSPTSSAGGGLFGGGGGLGLGQGTPVGRSQSISILPSYGSPSSSSSSHQQQQQLQQIVPPPPPASSSSAQVQQQQSRSRRTSSSHRTMAYSPNPPPSSTLPDHGGWSLQAAQQHAASNVGVGGASGVGVGSTGLGLGMGALPQSGLMRRGTSHDGVGFPPYNGVANPNQQQQPPQQQQQQQPQLQLSSPSQTSNQRGGGSLLPTSYSRPPQPSYSPSNISASSSSTTVPPPPPSSLMPGGLIRNSYSPSQPSSPSLPHHHVHQPPPNGNSIGSSNILPPTSPSVPLSLFGFSPNPNNPLPPPPPQSSSSQTAVPPPPPTSQSTSQQVPIEHNRHTSYSPSQYSTHPNQQSLPPSQLSQQQQSFYAHHIPSTSSTTSLPTTSSQSVPISSAPPPPPPHSSLSNHVLHPPQNSQSPQHHPQAQQYYQSQQYFDSTLAPSSSSTSTQQTSLPNPNQPSQSAPPIPSSSSSQQSQNEAAQYYAGGEALRSSTSMTGSGSGSSAMAGINYTGPPNPPSSTSPATVGGGSGRASGGAGGGQESVGFKKVRDVREIRRTVNVQPVGRRADPAGGFVSPLKALTVSLPQTYHLVNPTFRYETSLNPRRVLTKPSKPAGNDGFDNDDSDYILYVNDVLGPEEKDRYLILDVLGQGTFGQVVKCQNMKTHEIVAVKVVKNKPAYFQQSMMEVTILELINNQWDKDDTHHMLRLKDTFIHHAHLCLVFELLSNNLYELIKQNSFRGLSTSLVRVFTAQLLDALTVLQEAKIIHCDLKPENILLKSLQSPTIKVIDFGSACHEKQTVYTYIQSRFYRSPEVILSLPYSVSIDMWSLGCICVELFLGLPLFPGTSEYNQITRIVEMLGMPPDHMLDQGKQSSNFFDSFPDEYGRRRYRLKSLERYSAEHKTQEQPSKKYFSATTLPEIIKQYPITKRGIKETEIDKEMLNRVAFIDFVKGLLQIDPELRWSPQQARLHPFVLGEPLKAPFVPPPMMKPGFGSGSKVLSNPNSPDPNSVKRYGGLPPAPQRSTTRTYQDAKAYNTHLNQQQGYHVQAQQQAARAAQIPTNPYAVVPPPVDATKPGPNAAYGGAVQQAMAQQQQQQQQQQMQAVAQAQQAQAMNLSFYGGGAGVGGRGGAPPQQGGGPGPSSMANQQQQQQQQLSIVVANPPAVHHYTPRGRSNTLTQQDLPPALQKLGHDLGMQGGNGQSITPVLRREEQWQAWERHQNGQGAGGDGQGGIQRRISISRNPHLNLLQEQAENGLNSWNSPMRGGAKPAYSSYAVGGQLGPAPITAPPQAYSTDYAPYAPPPPTGTYQGFNNQVPPPPPNQQLSNQQPQQGNRQSFYSSFYST